MAVFPIHVEGLRYATAQLVARREGKIYLMQIPGIATTLCLENGKTLKNLRPRGTQQPVYANYYLLTPHDAQRLFLADAQPAAPAIACAFNKVRDAGPLRQVKKGKAKVAEAPSEADWQQAAVYHIQLPAAPSDSTLRQSLLSIDYQGDCARLYADGRLVADNFYYGRRFLYGLWRLPQDCRELQLRIMPLQSGVPVYLPREADKTPGEQLKHVEITPQAQ
jgi:hypothetical protein